MFHEIKISVCYAAESPEFQPETFQWRARIFDHQPGAVGQLPRLIRRPGAESLRLAA